MGVASLHRGEGHSLKPLEASLAFPGEEPTGGPTLRSWFLGHFCERYFFTHESMGDGTRPACPHPAPALALPVASGRLL